MKDWTRLFHFGLVCLCLSIAVTAQNSSPRGITPEDYYSFEFASDPQISPDGKLVAYVVTKIDRAQNRRNSSIWMVATDGSRAPWQFTTSSQSSNSPRWSPDGTSLAFLSSRPADSSSAAPSASPNPIAGSTPAAAAGASSEQPRNQIYLLSMNGGEARRITSLKNGVSVFHWSPDGCVWSSSVALAHLTAGATAAPKRPIAATCGITGTRPTNSMTLVGSMIGAHICGSST